LLTQIAHLALLRQLLVTLITADTALPLRLPCNLLVRQKLACLPPDGSLRFFVICLFGFTGGLYLGFGGFHFQYPASLVLMALFKAPLSPLFSTWPSSAIQSADGILSTAEAAAYANLNPQLKIRTNTLFLFTVTPSCTIAIC